MKTNHTTSALGHLLDFLRRAEALKSTLRTAWTRSGRQESAAEHSWRLSLFAMLVSRDFPDLDALKIQHLCTIHDLGEAIHGDIPAPEQTGAKDEQERIDMVDLLRPLPEEMREEFISLWEEYEYGQSPEACFVKALDKLETLLQQTQGANPPGCVDYVFNLDYGTQYTGFDGVTRKLREIVDCETQSCISARKKQKNMG